MTLLEALVALVILGLTAVGYVDTFRGATDGARDAATWSQAVAHAESSLEAASLGAPLPDSLPGYGRAVARAPWRGRLDVVTVIVVLPRGQRLTLRRVVPRATLAAVPERAP